MPKSDDFEDLTETEKKETIIKNIYHMQNEGINFLADMEEVELKDLVFDVVEQMRAKEMKLNEFYSPEELIYEAIVSEKVDKDLIERGISSLLQEYGGNKEEAKNALNAHSGMETRNFPFKSRLRANELQEPSARPDDSTYTIVYDIPSKKYNLFASYIDHVDEIETPRRNNDNNWRQKRSNEDIKREEKLKPTLLALQTELKPQRDTAREALRAKSKRRREGNVIGGIG